MTDQEMKLRRLREEAENLATHLEMFYDETKFGDARSIIIFRAAQRSTEDTIAQLDDIITSLYSV